jgi:hypothetical protein
MAALCTCLAVYFSIESDFRKLRNRLATVPEFVTRDALIHDIIGLEPIEHSDPPTEISYLSDTWHVGFSHEIWVVYGVIDGVQKVQMICVDDEIVLGLVAP